MAALPSRLALLGPKTTRQSKAQEDGSDAVGISDEEVSGGGGAAAGEGGRGQQQQPPPSLILRVVNPQQDTLVRLRITAAAESDPPTAGFPAAEHDSEGSPPSPAAAAAAVAGASVAAPTVPSVVTVQPKCWNEGDLLRLEGKEDEVLRQPGDRHRLPDGVLPRPNDGNSGGAEGSLERAAGDRAATGAEAPFLVHQHGDVAWVRVALDKRSVDRIAAAASSSANASLVVDVRFSLVMGEGEEGGAGEDVSMPISVRFPLSSCPA